MTTPGDPRPRSLGQKTRTKPSAERSRQRSTSAISHAFARFSMCWTRRKLPPSNLRAIVGGNHEATLREEGRESSHGRRSTERGGRGRPRARRGRLCARCRSPGTISPGDAAWPEIDRRRRRTPRSSFRSGHRLCANALARKEARAIPPVRRAGCGRKQRNLAFGAAAGRRGAPAVVCYVRAPSATASTASNSCRRSKGFARQRFGTSATKR